MGNTPGIVYAAMSRCLLALLRGMNGGRSPAITAALYSISRNLERRSASEKGYTLVADDSRYTRKIIEDLVMDKKFSSDVLSFENGLELTSAYSKFLAGKQAVDVAIIDLNMPVMNGLTAARAIRAIEAQKKHSLCPDVFFSAEKADDDLKEQMRSLEPAYYVNKGADPDPDSLKSRVEHLLCYLREKYRPQSA